jgi:RNA binding exosome subunit
MAVMNVKEEECLKSSNSNVDKPKFKQNTNFFDRVDELKAYKEKHGHLNVSHKEDKGLYHFCYNMRQARKGKMGCFRLDDGRVAALDAIGFMWEVEASTAAFRDDSFFTRVDKLKAYKGKHGHLNIRRNENESLYRFCIDVRRARKAKVTEKGKGCFRLDDNRIAALDAIGFEWDPGTLSTAAIKKDDNFFARVDKLRAYKEEHGHLNVQKKLDKSLYDFCKNVRQSQRAINAGKGKIHYRLDDDRMAALDAIGFEWI